jgi:hypothetical protein
MRWTTGAALGLMAAMNVRAVEISPASEPLTVRVFDAAGVRPDVLAAAREIVSGIYEQIGVHLIFTTGDAQMRKQVEQMRVRFAGPGCPSVTAVDVKLAIVPPQESPRALAYARPFFRDGIRVVVAMDRVYAHSRLTGARAEVILGLVLAHEIGHVLKGTDGHAILGLMRAQLPGDKLLHASAELQAFERSEIRLMRDNIARSLVENERCVSSGECRSAPAH